MFLLTVWTPFCVFFPPFALEFSVWLLCLALGGHRTFLIRQRGRWSLVQVYWICFTHTQLGERSDRRGAPSDRTSKNCHAQNSATRFLQHASEFPADCVISTSAVKSASVTKFRLRKRVSLTHVPPDWNLSSTAESLAAPQTPVHGRVLSFS